MIVLSTKLLNLLISDSSVRAVKKEHTYASSLHLASYLFVSIICDGCARVRALSGIKVLLSNSIKELVSHANSCKLTKLI